MTKDHTHKAYSDELRQLQDRILLIAARVEKMIANSVKALALRDVSLARETIEYDKSIDREEILIDRQCIELLARRQPLGEDLRFIVSVIKMVTYFERLGDLAVKISQRSIKLNHTGATYTIEAISEMAQTVQSMIRETLDAFVHRDAKKALAVIRRDQMLDKVYQETTRRYIQELAANHDFECNYHLLSIAKWLERMGDHCTNLAELTFFMVKGEDVRHKQIEKEMVN